MNLLELCNIQKVFKRGNKDFVLFDDLNLTISGDDHMISLIGADGSGKSTLLKIICALERINKGSVHLFEKNASRADLNFIKSIGYMSQTLGQYSDVSVFENLKLFSTLNNGKQIADKQLLELLDNVGLLKFKDYAQGSLSGGMKQKLGLACAIASNPRVLILDEPTVGVDPYSREQLWDIIEQFLKQDDKYCIFSSLYLEESSKTDRTILIKDGKILINDNYKNIEKISENKCFSLVHKNVGFQDLARFLTQYTNADSASPIIDICPRLGQINILTKDILPTDTLKDYIDKVFVKFNIPLDYRISKRAGILEDSYLLLTYEGKREDASLYTNIELKNNVDYTQKVIKASNIKKVFNKFVAVNDTSFDVYKGEIFGLLGPNGAGKTTTFRMICALLNPSYGSILINDQNLQKAKSSVRKQIGYVAQKFSLYQNITTLDNLKYFAKCYGLDDRQIKTRIDELSEEFDLFDYWSIKTAQLPFGVQRQLSMACALVHKPSILFLDEATSGADPKARRKFWSQITKLKLMGTSIIITTHFMEEAEYCDRFLIVDQGKMLFLGTSDDICQKENTRVSIQEAFIDIVRKNRGDNI